MKHIKNLVKTLFLLPIAVLVGCENEYETPEPFTDLSITWTTTTSNKLSQVDYYYSFMDLSAGAEYQEWRIPENTFFLQGPIPNNLKNHDDYIIEPAENISTDKTVHVLFKKGNSETKIGYYGVFKDSTSFRFNSGWDSVLNESIEDTIKTVNIDGKWIAEYYFTLDVYDTVVASPQVRELDGTVIDHLNTTSKTITFGDKLVFEDLSAFVADNNARPELTRWRVRSIEPNEEDRKTVYTGNLSRDGDFEIRINDTITFNKLGEYRVELKATRERTEDLKVSEDTITMPIVFNVVALAEDLVLDASIPVTERDDDRIRIPVSSQLMEIEGNVAEDFTVEVDGTVIPVESISLGSRSEGGVVVGGFIFLTLDMPLEPTDAGKTVTVSYSGTDIMSRDERVLQTFSDAPVEVYVPAPMNQEGEVLESDMDEILIRFNQNIDPQSIVDSADPAAGFMVTLNGAAFDIASMSVDSENAKMLKIVMSGDGKLYQDDIITIAYTSPGDIRSVGGGAIADFAAKTIKPFFGNLLTDGGFEGAFGDYWVAGSGGAGATVEFSTDVAFEGTQSAKLTALKPRLESDATITYEDGTYVISYRRYILSSSVTLDVAFHQLDHGDKIWLDSADGTTAVTPRWYGDVYPLGTAPALDTWELVEATKVMAAAANKKIRIQPVPTGGTDFTVYYDDFKIYKEDLRP